MRPANPDFTGSDNANLSFGLYRSMDPGVRRGDSLSACVYLGKQVNRNVITSLLASLWLASALAASPPLKTRAETSNYTETPRYQETLEYFQAWADSAPEQAKLLNFGRSAQDRTQFALVLASGGELTPEQARASGKPVLMLQACIHAGENEGKDALMALTREWLHEGKQQAARDSVILLLLPIFNVDGHERFSAYSRINQNGPNEMGWRSTAQNYNLNRDFLKAEAPEMRHWLTLWNTWNPSLLVDMHNTDGSDYQYQLTYHFETSTAVHPAIAAWQTQTWLNAVVPATEKAGFLMAPYVDLKTPDDIKAGIVNNYSPPRYSAGFGVAVNRPALLLETHMMKPFKTRVQVNMAFVRALLASIGGNPKALTDAVEKADADALVAAGTTVPLDFKVTEAAQDFAFKGYAYSASLSEISGGLWTRYDQGKPETWTVPYFSTLEPTLSVQLPAAYLIPRQWHSAIRLLRQHGIKMTKLTREHTLTAANTYRFSEVTFAPQPFEGRVRPATLSAKAVTEALNFPAGSMLVPVNQPRALLIANLLEPLAPDSIMRQGLGDGALTRAEYAEPRVLEAKARALLADQSLAGPKGDAARQLQADFAAKMRDPLFAGSSSARLDFFYQRLPHYDANYLRYPIARLSAADVEKLHAD
jgi:hypothetical protein